MSRRLNFNELNGFPEEDNARGLDESDLKELENIAPKVEPIQNKPEPNQVSGWGGKVKNLLLAIADLL